MKMAEKLLLELKGRIERLSVGLDPDRLGILNAKAATGMAADPIGETAREAVAALEALDVHAGAARRAVAKAVEELGETAGVEALVREGLRHRHL